MQHQTADSFTERFRLIHARLGITQDAAASTVGVTPTSYSRWHSGKARPLSHTRRKIERALGLELGVLGYYSVNDKEA